MRNNESTLSSLNVRLQLAISILTSQSVVLHV